MAWNIFLNIVPLIIAKHIFLNQNSPLHIDTKLTYKTNKSKLQVKTLNQSPLSKKSLNGALWLALFIIFYLFLPNEPYVITDILHFYDQIRWSMFSYSLISILLIPQYLILILSGMINYILNIRIFTNWAQAQKSKKRKLWFIFIYGITPVIMSIAIWLGRFFRFNSWEFFHKLPKILSQFQFLTLPSHQFFIFIIFIFVNILNLIAYLSLSYKVVKIKRHENK